QGKQKYLGAEHGEGVAVMRAVKAALDPQNILNPGKILPA
ncbi:MAG TPA: FAD-linked oxidase C-terminal domain-containing protein, partial [Hyphomicrobiaceae bacterium]|nr:FAD-linked oxidase C-terminal domain-containing protein [Hyphomicrobiaceae bacterium]